jgi:hypothetical protein
MVKKSVTATLLAVKDARPLPGCTPTLPAGSVTIQNSPVTSMPGLKSCRLVAEIVEVRSTRPLEQIDSYKREGALLMSSFQTDVLPDHEPNVRVRRRNRNRRGWSGHCPRWISAPPMNPLKVMVEDSPPGPMRKTWNTSVPGPRG